MNKGKIDNKAAVIPSANNHLDPRFPLKQRKYKVVFNRPVISIANPSHGAISRILLPNDAKLKIAAAPRINPEIIQTILGEFDFFIIILLTI